MTTRVRVHIEMVPVTFRREREGVNLVNPRLLPCMCFLITGACIRIPVTGTSILISVSISRGVRSTRINEFMIRSLLITDYLIKEDSPFCLTRAITRTMISPCFTPLSLERVFSTSRLADWFSSASLRSYREFNKAPAGTAEQSLFSLGRRLHSCSM